MPMLLSAVKSAIRWEVAQQFRPVDAHVANQRAIAWALIRNAVAGGEGRVPLDRLPMLGQCERLIREATQRRMTKLATQFAAMPASNDAALSDPVIARHIAENERLLQLAIDVPFVLPVAGGAR